MPVLLLLMTGPGTHPQFLQGGYPQWITPKKVIHGTLIQSPQANARAAFLDLELICITVRVAICRTQFVGDDSSLINS
ncbi:hypothetical protein C8R48DRAFT_705401 [Suillus tomentosus]|nr:hypothetical protein C8R48DRAFT_705401 [Suillus tomentosus]